jgi:hypothetical protein
MTCWRPGFSRGAWAGGGSSGPFWIPLEGWLRLLLEEAPRLVHEVVEALVAAVDELTCARYGELDLLECVERWVPGRFGVGHDCSLSDASRASTAVRALARRGEGAGLAAASGARWCGTWPPLP